MKAPLDNKALRTIALVVVAALCISSSAFALTKEELLAYSDHVLNIVEENSLQLKPGALKKLSREERQKRAVELTKAMNANDADWHELLSYYSELFRRCAERLSKEAMTRDPDLMGWNKKLVTGYQDSHEVTKLALSLLTSSDMAGLEQALSNTVLQKRISHNRKFHRNLQGELDKIIKSYLPTDGEVQRLTQRLAGLHVETTWK